MGFNPKNSTVLHPTLVALLSVKSTKTHTLSHSSISWETKEVKKLSLVPLGLAMDGFTLLQPLRFDNAVTYGEENRKFLDDTSIKH